jgi:hypothetical protein
VIDLNLVRKINIVLLICPITFAYQALEKKIREYYSYLHQELDLDTGTHKMNTGTGTEPIHLTSALT